MNYKDIKPGMRVIYKKGTEDEDIGTVTSDGTVEQYSVEVLWDSDGLALKCSPSNIEPLVTEGSLGSFTVNPGKTVQKIVEVQEPETYTITLSRGAVQELRAIVGGAYYSEDKAIYKETQELREMLGNAEDMLLLKEPFNMHFE